MGMNNWGGITEHMLKKPRSVFSGYKKKEPIRRNPKKREIQINEEEILKIKSRKLIKDLLFWYGLPFLVVLIVIILIIQQQL